MCKFKFVFSVSFEIELHATICFLSTDDKSNTIYTKRLRGGRHPVDFNISSGINKNLLKKETWEIKKETTKKPSIQLASVSVDLLDTINIIDTFDNPKNTSVEGKYANH